MFALFVTLARLTKWVLFLLVALSLVMMHSEYESQVDDNVGFSYGMDKDQRANAKNSRVALHSSKPSDIIPAPHDNVGPILQASKPGATNVILNQYYKDPRIGINPYGVLPSVIVGHVNETSKQTLAQLKILTPTAIANTFDEKPAGGTLKIDCDEDYLVEKDSSDDFTDMMAASGAAISVGGLITAASSTDGDPPSLCNTNSPASTDQYACYDKSVYKPKTASYVDDMVNATTADSDSVPMPNRNCESIFSPTNFATNKDGDKSQTAYFIAGIWDGLCTGNNSVMTNGAGTDLCGDFDPTGATDPNNKSTVQNTEMCTHMDGLTDSKSEMEYMFQQILTLLMLDPSHYSDVNLIGTVAETLKISVLTTYTTAIIDNECGAATCPQYLEAAFEPVGDNKMIPATCDTDKFINICEATFNVLDSLNVDYRNYKGTTASGKTAFFSGEVKAKLTASKSAGGTAFAAVLDAVTTDGLKDAPVATEETQKVCASYQSGQDTLYALAITSLVLMFIGLLLILASVYKNVERGQSFDEKVDAYKNKKLSYAARVVNTSGYLLLILAFFVGSHYASQGQTIGTYMSTVIYGPLTSANPGETLEVSEVVPNQPISFGTSDGYVKNHMTEDNGDPSYPYDYGVTVDLLIVATVIFAVDGFLTLFGKQLGFNSGEGHMGGMHGGDTMMSRLTQSIL